MPPINKLRGWWNGIHERLKISWLYSLAGSNPALRTNIFLELFMQIKCKINELNLNQNDTVVVGSGILNACGIRDSKDIDLVVTEEAYAKLFYNTRFRKEMNHGREILVDNLFEIGTNWTVIGKTWEYSDLLNYSVIIDGVRYITVEFLFDAKKSWIASGDGREKDIDDVKLMEKYLKYSK